MPLWNEFLLWGQQLYGSAWQYSLLIGKNTAGGKFYGKSKAEHSDSVRFLVRTVVQPSPPPQQKVLCEPQVPWALLLEASVVASPLAYWEAWACTIVKPLWLDCNLDQTLS